MNMHPGDSITCRDGSVIPYEVFARYRTVINGERVIQLPITPGNTAYIKIGDEIYVPVRKRNEWTVMKIG